MLFSASMAALASRSRSTTESWPHAAAKCSGVRPREPQGPRPKAAGRTQPNQGEKNLEKILAPQKSKFWKWWTLKCPLKIVVLRCLEAVELVERHVVLVFY